MQLESEGRRTSIHLMPTLPPYIPDGLDEVMIRQVVFGFSDQVRADAELAPVFDARIAPEAWPHHLETMCDFWSSVLMRTGRYHGRPMPKHLALPELTDAHFHRWLSLFRITVRDLCPPAVADLFLDRAFNIAQAFRLQIAIRDGRDALAVEPFTEADLTPAA